MVLPTACEAAELGRGSLWPQPEEPGRTPGGHARARGFLRVDAVWQLEAGPWFLLVVGQTRLNGRDSAYRVGVYPSHAMVA